MLLDPCCEFYRPLSRYRRAHTEASSALENAVLAAYSSSPPDSLAGSGGGVAVAPFPSLYSVLVDESGYSLRGTAFSPGLLGSDLGLDQAAAE